MNRFLLLAACLSFTSLALSADEPAAKTDKFYLVEISDFCGTESVETMGSAEFKKLGDDIKLESRLFTKALTLTEKEWRTDEATKSKTFPRAAIKPREVKILDQAASKKVIEDKLSAFEEKQADREKDKADREAKRAKEKEARNKSAKSNRNTDKKGGDDRDIMEMRAVSMFKSQIETLKTAPPVPPKAEAPKAEAGKAEAGKAAEPPAKP
jgi:hypothetical protein